MRLLASLAHRTHIRAELEEFLTAFNKQQEQSARTRSEGQNSVWRSSWHSRRVIRLQLPFTSRVEFDDADIVTPIGKCAVYGLTCAVEPGRHLLVDGPTGAGKSSLFRSLGGAWRLRGRHCSHSLCRTVAGPPRPRHAAQDTPGHIDVAAVPGAAEAVQSDRLAGRPDHVPSEGGAHSRRGQEACDARARLRRSRQYSLRELLAVVQLSYLVDREGGWNATANWADVLSLGEQQRLGMARLFFHRPKFAVLDQVRRAPPSHCDPTRRSAPMP